MVIFLGDSSICIFSISIGVMTMSNKQTQRKPVNSRDYKHVLNERVKQMNPLQVAAAGNELYTLMQIERYQTDIIKRINDTQTSINQTVVLLTNCKWYQLELKATYTERLRGLIEVNHVHSKNYQTSERDADDSRNRLDVLLNTIKRG